MFEEQQRFKCKFKDIIKYFKCLFKYLNIGRNLNNLYIINNYMYLITDQITRIGHRLCILVTSFYIHI